MGRVRFEAVVARGRPDQPRYVIMDAAAVESLGIERTTTVSGTVAGVPFVRQNVKPLGKTGTWFLDVTAAMVKTAGIDEGDVVEVALEPVEEGPPVDLVAALAADPAAQAWWDGATAQKRRQMVNDIERAKAEPTRQARIGKWVQLVGDWQRATGRSSF